MVWREYPCIESKNVASQSINTSEIVTSHRISRLLTQLGVIISKVDEYSVDIYRFTPKLKEYESVEQYFVIKLQKFLLKMYAE